MEVAATGQEGGGRLSPGRSPGLRLFRLLYLGVAMLYALVILFWGRHDMERIHREYRQVTERLASGYALEMAGREVAAGCSQAVGGEGVPGYQDCLRRGASQVVQRAAALTAELENARRQVLEKLAIFYLLVTLLLIIVPVTLLYVILVALIYLLSNIRYKQE